MKINYPVYSREQDRRCRLSTQDIIEIKKMYLENQHNISQIAKRFNVTPNTIRYNLFPIVKERQNKRSLDWGAKNREKKRLSTKKWRDTGGQKRKYLLQRKEMSDAKKLYRRYYWSLIKLRKKDAIRKTLGFDFYYTTKDIEKILKVSRERIRQLRNEGRIKFYKIDKRFYYPQDFIVKKEKEGAA